MLSIALEDSTTLTSPLIPWNTCGAYIAGMLGISVFVYVPCALLNLINPIVSLVMMALKFKIARIDDDEKLNYLEKKIKLIYIKPTDKTNSVGFFIK